MASQTRDWTDAQKTALVEQIVLRRITLQQACTQYGLSTDQLKDWVRIFRRAARLALDRQLRSTLSIQGLDVEELSSAELSGKIGDISLPDLIQTIEMGHKDALITIAHDGLRSSIWCKAGSVIDAESGPLCGKPALLRLLALDRGNVLAAFSVVDRPRAISCATHQLLLESATFRDHKNRLLQRLRDAPSVLAVIPGIAARQIAELNPNEMAILSLFDGQRSLREVVAASHLFDLQTLEIVVRFFEAGLLGATSLAPASDRTPTSSITNLATSYRAQSTSRSPRARSAQPPGWVLAAGAIVCSSLGAVTAIAYADTLFNGVAAAAASALSPQRPQCPEGMALIAGGELTVGSDSTHPSLQLSRPAHRARVEDFCLDITEVTVSRYHACEKSGHCAPAHRRARFHRQEVSSANWQRSEELHSQQCNAGRPGREQHPINCVSYRQASSYCAQRGQRLPSEREWELAARGLSGRRFPWGDAPPTAAHVNACGPECTSWHQSVGLTGEIQGRLYDRDDGFPGTAPVASFPDGATPEAVYDLVGNVFEWTSGSPYSYATPAAGALSGSLDSTSAVIRGGSYNSGTPELLDPALRFAMRAELHSHGVGFRCAASPDAAR